MRTIIQNGMLVLPEGAVKGDLAFEDGVITAAGKVPAAPEDMIFDAEGCWVFPGFIDQHTHLEADTGMAWTADDFSAGTLASCCPVYVVHLSSRLGLEEVRAARRRGKTVYVETCPQYLLLEDSVYKGDSFEGAKYVCSPPIRKKEDIKALREALLSGDGYGSLLVPV